MTDLAPSFLTVQKTITETCKAAKRNPQDVHLIAVSKRQPMAKIQATLETGHRIFGENRVQEAYDHWQGLREQYTDLELHLIGPLQSNKVKEAVAFFDVIHSVDREKIARKIRQEMERQGRSLACFIQVNTGEEPQKSGILPHDLADFVSLCRDDLQLNIQGLMCIPPVDDIPAFHFALLKKYADQFDLPKLSMGMSCDFEAAIYHGAHYIRIGTALFGERKNTP